MAQSTITIVPLPEDIARSTEVWEVALHVEDFVKHALDDAMYEEDELPREALMVAWLSRYLGEVDNGGHAQYAENTLEDAHQYALVADALSAIGAADTLAIFDAFRTFAAAEPDRFEQCSGDFDDIDPFFYELDDRRSALGGSNPTRLLLDQWLRTRGWLRPPRPYTWLERVRHQRNLRLARLSAKVGRWNLRRRGRMRLLNLLRKLGASDTHMGKWIRPHPQRPARLEARRRLGAAANAAFWRAYLERRDNASG